MPARAPVLTLRELNRALLARQMLLRREKVGVVEAIERLGGLQAQWAPSPYVALWSRLATFDRDRLTRPIDRGAVVKATLMRATLHLVSAREYPAYALATSEGRFGAWRPPGHGRRHRHVEQRPRPEHPRRSGAHQGPSPLHRRGRTRALRPRARAAAEGRHSRSGAVPRAIRRGDPRPRLVRADPHPAPAVPQAGDLLRRGVADLSRGRNGRRPMDHCGGTEAGDRGAQAVHPRVARGPVRARR